MNHTISLFIRRFRKIAIPSSFVATFFIVALSAWNLKLFADDYTFYTQEPNISSDFIGFYSNYLKEWGLFRPAAVLYYWLVFSVYKYSSGIAHLIPLGIHVFSGYLLYFLLRRHGLRNDFSYLAGLLFVLHPFSTQQYMWLAANPGTVAQLFFLLQIWVIGNGYTVAKSALLVTVLGLLGILTYESTFFMFVPVGYLLLKELSKRYHLTIEKISIIIISLLVPIGVYIVNKLVFPTIDPRPVNTTIPLLASQGIEAIQNIVDTQVADYYRVNFWDSYMQEGWQVIHRSLVAFITFLLWICSTAIALLFVGVNRMRSVKTEWLFWVLAALFSIPPLMANQHFTFGYRSLFLPVMLLFVVFLWAGQLILRRIGSVAVKIVLVWFSTICLLVSIAMTDNYQIWYEKDMSLAQDIAYEIAYHELAKEDDSLAVVLRSDIPFDSSDTFIHADTFLSCFYYEWSVIPCMSMKTDGIGVFAIVHADGSVSVQNDYSLEDVNSYVPRIELRLTDEEELYIEELIRKES